MRKSAIIKSSNGFIYWLVTASPLAAALGSVIRCFPFDRLGPLTLPETTPAETVTGIACGAYEYSERYLIRRWLPSQFDVVELGASIGIVSREILNKLEPRTKLVAVEAMPLLAEIAEKNIGKRQPVQQWSMIQAAIAYGCKDVSFETGASHIAGKIAAKGSGSLHLQTKALASILSEFGLVEYSLVMDIEGAEYEVLRHDSESLATCRCIIAELHGERTEKQFFCQHLENIGMKFMERKHSVVVFTRS